MRLPADVLTPQLGTILEGVLLWAADSKNKFKLKVGTDECNSNSVIQFKPSDNEGNTWATLHDWFKRLWLLRPTRPVLVSMPMRAKQHMRCAIHCFQMTHTGLLPALERPVAGSHPPPAPPHLPPPPPGARDCGAAGQALRL